MTPATKNKITAELTTIIAAWGEKLCASDGSEDLGIYWSANYAYHMASIAVSVLDAQHEVAEELLYGTE